MSTNDHPFGVIVGLTLLLVVSQVVWADDSAQELARQGQVLARKDAVGLELELAADPSDLSSRTRLLGYYWATSDHAARLRHVLWIIENRPDAEAAGSSYAEFNPERARELYVQAKSAWFRQTRQQRKSKMVLANAARFFRNEPEMAERFHEKVLELEVYEAVGEEYAMRFKYKSAGRYEDAVRVFKQTLEARRGILGDNHSRTLKAVYHLGELYGIQGLTSDAEPLLEDYVAYARKSPQQNSITLSVALAHLAKVRISQGRFADAEDLCRECLLLRMDRMPDHWTLFNTKSLLGESMARQSKFADAERLLVDGYEGLKEREEKIHSRFRAKRLRDAIQRLVSLYDAWGRPAEEAKWRAELQRPTPVE